MFHSSVFGAKTRAGSCISQRAVAFHSGQLHFTAGSCISQRAVAFHSGQLHFTAGSCISQRAVAFQSGQLHFTASSCISQRAVAFQSGPDEKTNPLRKAPQLIRSIASFSLIKKNSWLRWRICQSKGLSPLSLWVRCLLRTDVKRVCLHH